MIGRPRSFELSIIMRNARASRAFAALTNTAKQMRFDQNKAGAVLQTERKCVSGKGAAPRRRTAQGVSKAGERKPSTRF